MGIIDVDGHENTLRNTNRDRNRKSFMKNILKQSFIKVWFPFMNVGTLWIIQCMTHETIQNMSLPSQNKRCTSHRWFLYHNFLIDFFFFFPCRHFSCRQNFSQSRIRSKPFLIIFFTYFLLLCFFILMLWQWFNIVRSRDSLNLNWSKFHLYWSDGRA